MCNLHESQLQAAWAIRNTHHAVITGLSLRLHRGVAADNPHSDLQGPRQPLVLQGHM